MKVLAVVAGVEVLLVGVCLGLLFTSDFPRMDEFQAKGSDRVGVDRARDQGPLDQHALDCGRRHAIL